MFLRRGEKRKRLGFTLIELLVVISIIGFLSTVAVVGLNSSRQKSRDAKRRADLTQVGKAIELYYDTNNAYPSTGGAWWGNCSTYGSHPTSGATGWVPNLAPTYMGTLPLDPRPVGTNYCYLYRSNATDYKLLAFRTVESLSPVPSTDGMYDPAGRTTSFAVYTPGARTW